MRWKGRQQSTNVEDRRGGGGKVIGGGIGVLVIAVIVYFLGGDPSAVLQQAGSVQQTQTTTHVGSQKEEEYKEFVSVVLKDTEDIWGKLFADMGATYEPPTLVIFTGSVNSGCGGASAATGPFYCPADKKLYIDLSFYDELRNRFGAPGDFAMAYVVAHEVGHHIQNLMGTAAKVQSQRGQISQVDYNKLSVRMELQADFFAGMWAHYADKWKNVLEDGDIEEALQAAHQIGDDYLQKQAQGRIVPDAFTHGTSQQRMFWFKRGYTTGDINASNTFASDAPM